MIILSANEDMINWQEWLAKLKKAAYINQEGKCICGEPFRGTGQLHHAIITRGDARGLAEGVKERVLHHSFNVILCHTKCHRDLVRIKCWEYLCDLYGEEEMREWYYNLPFKVLPRRFEIIKKGNGENVKYN